MPMPCPRINTSSSSFCFYCEPRTTTYSGRDVRKADAKVRGGVQAWTKASDYEDLVRMHLIDRMLEPPMVRFFTVKVRDLS